MEAQEIKEMIERGLPDALVEVRDFTGGGDHFEALVVSESFEGKGLVERHQAVYGALGDAMKARIHALTLKVMTPNQYQNRRREFRWPIQSSESVRRSTATRSSFS